MSETFSLNQNPSPINDVDTLAELVAANLSAAQVKDITMDYGLRTMD